MPARGSMKLRTETSVASRACVRLEGTTSRPVNTGVRRRASSELPLTTSSPEMSRKASDADSRNGGRDHSSDLNLHSVFDSTLGSESDPRKRGAIVSFFSRLFIINPPRRNSGASPERLRFHFTLPPALARDTKSDLASDPEASPIYVSHASRRTKKVRWVASC